VTVPADLGFVREVQTLTTGSLATGAVGVGGSLNLTLPGADKW